MPTDLDPDSIEYQRRFEEHAAEQRRRHEADPYNKPLYLSADDPEFPTEAWTAGGRRKRTRRSFPLRSDNPTALSSYVFKELKPHVGPGHLA